MTIEVRHVQKRPKFGVAAAFRSSSGICRPVSDLDREHFVDLRACRCVVYDSPRKQLHHLLEIRA